MLSLAITRACNTDKDGIWTVIEYEDEVYRLTKTDGQITIEVLR